MPDEQKTVFISYRRSLSSDAARAVFLDLRYHGYDVFLDVDSINSGQFDTIILRQIEARAHFVLILTPGTVERCAESGDWLRREIEFAMEKQRNIVLLLYNGFSFTGTEKYLTGKLSELSRYNGMTVPHDYFDPAMDKLRTRFLQPPVYVVTKPAPASDQPEVQRKIAEAAAQPTEAKQQLSAEDYLMRGNARYSGEDLDGALANYNEALRLNPQYALAYNNRGAARQAKGDLDGAIADYNEALRLNPQDADAYNNRGIACKAKGDLDGAIADYNEAIRLNPQYAAAYYNRAGIEATRSQWQVAIADYQKYLDLGGGKQYDNQVQVEERIRELKAKLK